MQQESETNAYIVPRKSSAAAIKGISTENVKKMYLHTTGHVKLVRGYYQQTALKEPTHDTRRKSMYDRCVGSSTTGACASTLL